MNNAVQEVKHSMEEEEMRKKDVQKERREGSSHPTQFGVSVPALQCSEVGCGFVICSKACLVNHIGQKHGAEARNQQPCVFCGKLLYKQGFITTHDSMVITQCINNKSDNDSAVMALCGTPGVACITETVNKQRRRCVYIYTYIMYNKAVEEFLLKRWVKDF